MARAKPRPPCVKGAGGVADWGIAGQVKLLERQSLAICPAHMQEKGKHKKRRSE